MRKAMLGLFSLIPGVSFALEDISPGVLKITASSPEKVIKAISLVQQVNIQNGQEKVNLSMDTVNNSIELSQLKDETADTLIDKLRQELGTDVTIEKKDVQSLSHGTQDSLNR